MITALIAQPRPTPLDRNSHSGNKPRHHVLEEVRLERFGVDDETNVDGTPRIDDEDIAREFSSDDEDRYLTGLILAMTAVLLVPAFLMMTYLILNPNSFH